MADVEDQQKIQTQNTKPETNLENEPLVQNAEKAEKIAEENYSGPFGWLPKLFKRD